MAKSRILVVVLSLALLAGCSLFSGTPDAGDAPIIDGPDEAADFVNPRLIHFEKPDYPEEARADREEGTVIVKIRVSEDGRVLSASIIQSVTERLDDAAFRAAFKCRFEPATAGGEPVAAWMAIPFAFSLIEKD